MPKSKGVPEGCHTLTPYLVVNGADQAMAFYRQAFGAEEVSRMPGPDGKSLVHATLRIGDSLIYLSDEFPGAECRSPQALGGTAVGLHLYVADVDAAFQRAVAAGARPAMPPADMFWGDRYAKVSDPFGHQWSLATRLEEVAPAELARRAQTFFTEMAQQHSGAG